MRFSLQTTLVLASAVTSACFSLGNHRQATRPCKALSMAAEDDKVATLRAAAQKAREQAERLRQVSQPGELVNSFSHATPHN